jgi:phosphoribosylaminoimidazolecarboxamide formyltransferase/IMP cyclohydrolase
MPTAILSVHDKSGLLELAGGLHALGWKLLASGGTARLLRQNAIPVSEVADYTGSPEILSGRVKTLHPAIHGGLLARDNDADLAEINALGWEPIDLAAVNLYPFAETIARPGTTLEEAVEDIDIGGVTLLRAAAKNHARVTVLCEPGDYPAVLAGLQAGGVSAETRRRLAVKAFAHTARYDSAIHAYLSAQLAGGLFPDGARTDLFAESAIEEPEALELKLYPTQSLRYGENPHQSAILYAYRPGVGPLGGTVLQGKALSYNNLLDLDAAWRAAVSYGRPAIVIVKHLSPCGVACADTLEKAYRLALASDPVSAFGGVIAANRPFDGDAAAALGELFVECVAAPGFSGPAQEILARRKNLRLVDMPGTDLDPLYELRSVNQGVLRQAIDLGDPLESDWQVVSSRPPTEQEWLSLRFAWKACQHVKSNAIVFARGEATVGIGGGQPNRVDCVRIAAQRAGQQARGAVMASDAFFPFPDSVEEAAKAGITAIIEPGGSVRDAEAIAAAEAHGMALVFTGVRHFRH